MDDVIPHPIKKQSNTPLFIPSELISLILSYLNVKTITRFKCVNKSWNTLISHPTFVKFHFNKSSQNPHLITSSLTHRKSCVVSLRRLLKNPSSIAAVDHTFRFPVRTQLSPLVVSSCNGLLFLLFWELNSNSDYWFYVWNPATKTISDKLGFFRDFSHHSFEFTFGCDYLTGTYKVVALNVERKVKVFNLGDNCWREIQSFPFALQMGSSNHGVHLSGTVNWLATFKTSVEEYVIVSLDLSTETYTHFLLPNGFNEVTFGKKPSLQVLMDCLCFPYDFKWTEFVIWQMKEFGVQESWTMLFTIRYVDLQIRRTAWLPLYLPVYLSKNGDTVILANKEDDTAIIYNQRDKRVERAKISNRNHWFSAIEYAESLVAIPWKSGDIKKRKVKTKRKVSTKRKVIYKIGRLMDEMIR